MSLVAPPAANAGSAHGCVYPRVCFYRTMDDFRAGRPSAAYRDITAGWQWLGPASYGADGMWNTRNDDVAYLHFAHGGTMCLRPNMGFWTGTIQVDRIRISSSATC